MALTPREILSSATFTLVAGTILWPPASELIYWSIFDVLGDAVILLVLGASGAIGFGFGTFTTVSPCSFALGGTLGYLIGMGGIEVASSPESPVHFLLYGSLLAAMHIGVVVAKGGVESGN